MAQKPNDATLLAVSQCLEKGDITTAIVLLKSTLKQQPECYQAWIMLSKCLFDNGNMQESIHVAETAERFDPLQQEFRSVQSQMQRKAFGEAQRSAEIMLQKHAGHPRAIFTLAHLEKMKGNPERSINILLSGLSYSPANLTLRNMLIESQVAAGHYLDSIKTARVLVDTQETFDTVWVLINLLLKYGQHDALLDACDRAQAMSNGDKLKLSQVEMVRGQTLRIIGKREECLAAFHRSLAANPMNVEAWWALADMKNYSFSDQDRSAIQTLLSAPNLTQRAKCLANFALAKASEANDNVDATMALYHQANQLNDSNHFDPTQIENEFKARTQAYSKQTLTIQADSKDDKVTPIFIVGLPRSGSTLIEQILASHSQIEGTLEQPTLPIIEAKAQSVCIHKYRGDLFSKLSALSPSDLSELGTAYLQNGSLFRHSNKGYFTDKLPFNFRLIGLIHKILPHAKIIDIRRNPLDCGLSLYKQYFHSGVDFSYNLKHIGAFYNAYVELMSYWDQVLPNKVLSIQYEALVDAPDVEIPRLLNYIGVDFESDCLHFHATRRVVHTASSEQVREPINRQGVDAWRKVEAYLSPLIESLGKSPPK